MTFAEKVADTPVGGGRLALRAGLTPRAAAAPEPVHGSAF